MNQLKICGINDAAFAARAASLGVDYLGFIFFAASPRAVNIEKAKEIIAHLPAGYTSRLVGVFVDMSANEIRRCAEKLGLSVLQLHGPYPSHVVAALKKDYEVWYYWRQSFLPPRQNPADAFLIDSSCPGSGCLGNWQLAADLLAAGYRVVLAGGLSAANLPAAAKLGVTVLDINSSLESVPGQKNLEKLEKLWQQYQEIKNDSN